MFKKTFGVPREARSDEFYRNNRWMGMTAAERRFQRTMRIVLAMVIMLGAAAYLLR